MWMLCVALANAMCKTTEFVTVAYSTSNSCAHLVSTIKHWAHFSNKSRSRPGRISTAGASIRVLVADSCLPLGATEENRGDRVRGMTLRGLICGGPFGAASGEQQGGQEPFGPA